MTSTRQDLAAYESNGVRGLVVLVTLLSLGCFVLAWVGRHALTAVLGIGLLDVLLAVTTALIPRWTRSWYERNRKLVRLFDQQRVGHVGPPPPHPPPPLGGPATSGRQRGKGGADTQVDGVDEAP